MTGEMSAAEVTRENYPELFALRDALKRRGIASEPRPFDVYQGPTLQVNGPNVRAWYSQDEDASAVWMSDKRPLYAGGLFYIEGRGFESDGATHVHPETRDAVQHGCYTLRQAARRIAELAS